MEINIGKLSWQKRSLIEGILTELKENNKTIDDIEYIVKLGQIKYWVTWVEFINSRLKE